MKSRRKVKEITQLFILLFLIHLFLGVGSLRAQTIDSIENQKVRILPVPTFGHEPETRFYIGAVALLTYKFRDQRLSNAQAEFTYTLNKQSIAEIEYELFPNKWLALKGLWSFKNFPDLYWDIRSPWSLGENFTSVSFGGFSSFLYVVPRMPYLMFGPYLEFQSIRIKEFDPGGILDESLIGHKLSYSGIGANLILDNRDLVLNPSKGGYLDFLLKGYSNNESSIEVDARYFKKAFDKLVLALQGVGKIATFDNPLQMFRMGNSSYLRGYYRGNFRVNQLAVAQLEVRTPIIGRFGIASFGSIGSLSYSNTDHVLYSYGGGLRFKIDRKSNINLRFDYALGKQSSGFYVGFGEAF